MDESPAMKWESGDRNETGTPGNASYGTRELANLKHAIRLGRSQVGRSMARSCLRVEPRGGTISYNKDGRTITSVHILDLREPEGTDAKIMLGA